MTNQHFHYINSRIKNESHDLKFLYWSIREIARQDIPIVNEIKQALTKYMFKTIVPTDANASNISYYGVPEDTTIEPDKINNLEACFNFLIEKFGTINETVYGIVPNAGFHIDCNMKRKWIYKKAPVSTPAFAPTAAPAFAPTAAPAFAPNAAPAFGANAGAAFAPTFAPAFAPTITQSATRAFTPNTF